MRSTTSSTRSQGTAPRSRSSTSNVHAFGRLRAAGRASGLSHSGRWLGGAGRLPPWLRSIETQCSPRRAQGRRGPTGRACSPIGSRSTRSTAIARFAEVDAHANQLVRALRARGVEAGDGLALHVRRTGPSSWKRRRPSTRSGMRLTTVNWHLTGEEAGYIVDDCEATVFVADAKFAAAAEEAADGRAPAEGEDRDRRRHSRASSAGTTCSASTTARRSRIPPSAARCSTRRARPGGPRACAVWPTVPRSPLARDRIALRP